MKTTINDTRKIYSHKILHTVRFAKMNDATIQYGQSEIKSEKKERIGGQKKKKDKLTTLSQITKQLAGYLKRASLVIFYHFLRTFPLIFT